MIRNLLLASIFLLLMWNYSLAQKGIPKDTLIILERDPCYGVCPMYELRISANGNVEFELKELNKDYKIVSNKPIKSRISQEKLKQLISEFQKIDFFSLENNYGNFDYKADKNCPEIWTDASSATTSITINGKSKQVFHYHGCEGNPVLERLTKFENKIDEIVDTEQWLKEWRNKKMMELTRPS